jgi:hypothetical protein
MEQSVHASVRGCGGLVNEKRWAAGHSARQSFSPPVGPNRCFRAVLRKRGLILNYCGFERSHILSESGSKIAMLSGRTIYVIAPLHLSPL